MADPGALGDIGTLAAGAAGGGGLMLLASKVLGGLLQGWISGAGGQEKELRADLREEVKRLAGDLREARDEIDQVRNDLSRLHGLYLHVLTGRAEARAALNAHERLSGVPVTVWAPDPKEGDA